MMMIHEKHNAPEEAKLFESGALTIKRKVTNISC